MSISGSDATDTYAPLPATLPHRLTHVSNLRLGGLGKRMFLLSDFIMHPDYSLFISQTPPGDQVLPARGQERQTDTAWKDSCPILLLSDWGDSLLAL